MTQNNLVMMQNNCPSKDLYVPRWGSELFPMPGIWKLNICLMTTLTCPYVYLAVFWN